MAIKSKLLNLEDESSGESIREQWDDLFHRSSARLPTSRFEQVELWFEQFAPMTTPQAVIVEQDGKWIAALPLISTRFKWLIPSWKMPYSFWTPSPEFLVDEQPANEAAAYQEIVKTLNRGWRPLVRADELVGDPTGSNPLGEAFQRAGNTVDIQTRYEIGQVAIRGSGAPIDWDDFQQRLSGNLRRQMRKMSRRADGCGGVKLIVKQCLTADEVDKWIRVGFEIEDRGWKGENGSSALRTPGVLDFYIRQATMLARREELVLLFLEHKNKPIAFEYGWKFKRTYFSPKVAYDETFSNLSPGHLLMHLWIEEMFHGDEFDVFDFCGPLSEATAKWTTHKYPVVRLLAGSGFLGNAMLRTGQKLTAWRQRVREFGTRPATSEPAVYHPQESTSPVS